MGYKTITIRITCNIFATGLRNSVGIRGIRVRENREIKDKLMTNYMVINL